MIGGQHCVFRVHHIGRRNPYRVDIVALAERLDVIHRRRVIFVFEGLAGLRPDVGPGRQCVGPITGKYGQHLGGGDSQARDTNSKIHGIIYPYPFTCRQPGARP
jgi:hypothetical protein